MIIIQLIIFLCLFLTPIEGPPKGKHEGAGPSDGANELIVPDNLDKTNKKKYENRIKFLNELGDDKDKYNIFAQIGKVEEIYCNRCGKNVINSQKHYRADIISHNKAHKKMESPFPASAEETNKRFENMIKIRTDLGERSSCLTIIRESCFFVCELCKNNNHFKNFLFVASDLRDVQRHLENGTHKAIIDQNLDVNNLPPNLTFPDADEYYKFYNKNYVSKQQNSTNQPTLLNLFPTNNPQQGDGHGFDLINPPYDQWGSSYDPNA